MNMRFLKTGLLSICLMSNFCFGSAAVARDRWPEPEVPGSCRVGTTCNTYSTRHKPNDAKAIGGFYVNITSENSSATVKWTAQKCNREEFSGAQPISTRSTNQNYINFPDVGIPFSVGVCSFTYEIVNPQRTDGGTEIQFKFNYDVDW
jgi:hypothetical protein